MKHILAITLIVASITGAAWADGPRDHTVRVITDYDNLRLYFSPKTIVIAPGDTVTWINEAEEDHNMVAYPDGYPKGGNGFTSPMLKLEGQKWSQTFRVPGTYEYHCIPHLMLGMHGSVIVGRPSASSEFHLPDASQIAAYRRKLTEYFSDDEIVEFPTSTSRRPGRAPKNRAN